MPFKAIFKKHSLGLHEKEQTFPLFIPIYLFWSGTQTAQSLNIQNSDNDVDILIILPGGYRPNYCLIRDTFETFGWNVTTALFKVNAN